MTRLPSTATSPEENNMGRTKANRRWNEAVDWLLNSRHTADPDIQGPFWAYVDGHITREELNTFTAEHVAQREAEIQAVQAAKAASR